MLLKNVAGLVVAGCMLGGCAAGPTPLIARPPEPGETKTAVVAGDPVAKNDPAITTVAAQTDQPRQTGPWVGAAGGSDFVLSGTNDTVLGVWVDVPQGLQKGHAPSAVSLVIDTSGSMAGPKMENARASARALVDRLKDGDIVSIVAFSDQVDEKLPPTVLSASSRASINRVIAGLEPLGGTNMFDGLRIGESRCFNAPTTHPVRRVVMISDGIANVGPSSPEILGEVAAKGSEHGIQVTAVGVGLDYDERTLNALAIRSSGRLYHISEPDEMSAMLEKEIGLLQATAATDAFIEVVPAPGVQLLGADGIRTEWGTAGAMRIPLGTMFGGQHREALLRVRVTAGGDGQHALASVRFHFRDPSDGNLERVQEVVARYQVTSDRLAIEQHKNQKTQTILATQEASQQALAAAQQLNQGNFDEADKALAKAEEKLQASAAGAGSAADRQRILASAAQVSSVRKDARAAAAAPKASPAAAPRPAALKANKAAMEAAGF
ncbi:MAG: VWA domain-containing protein [Byssovorax sp.]